jgi:flagellar biosynthesis/type III secretory pathway protein FliH
LQASHRQSLGEMQAVAVELATVAASWLVGAAIDREMFAVDDLIMKSLEHLDLNQSVKVRLNSADHELLQTLMKDPASQSQLKQVSFEKDTTIPRGSVRVEAGHRILVTDMTTRLEEIRRTWMEKLDDSQIERRGDGPASRTLRRFPERRETA